MQEHDGHAGARCTLGAGAAGDDAVRAEVRPVPAVLGRRGRSSRGAAAGTGPGPGLRKEGGDALGLAALGWQVTAVDVSPSVLRRVQDRARAAGTGDRVSVEQHDLARTVPHGIHDLLIAAYRHSPVDLDRPSVLRAAGEGPERTGRHGHRHHRHRPAP